MNNRLIVITGLSGSGKSTAARALEDQGFFVVDNLPLVMLPDFMERARLELCQQTDIAVVIDVRNRTFLVDHAGTFERLRTAGHQVEILFFEANDDELLRRYSETRRTHPLAQAGTVQQGVENERRQLKLLRDAASRVIDSSNLNVRQLRDLVLEFVGTDQSARLIINIESFGYRYGLPLAADLVFDVRFLPNPHYIPELQPLTGLDQRVRDYVLSQPEARNFRYHLDRMLMFLLPHYRKEGKSYLTIGIGCTGGRHRSVSIVEDLYRHFPVADVMVQHSHRDVAKG
ncbi:RNase adapter RapZ [Pelovirga terrestris]|uniref:RNase adapter RapZ n=1 Tax=Pelovirga terrestris TaxID=2771352 RepID=A0A8J6R6Q3_9BACT|nr:RNase adapter RapZ [Pelovirga terrestris]MBD1401634.1 RNase adapter RapZ [Pelovirga terrestris]